MVLMLDITTSMEFWRRVYPTDRAPQDPERSTPADYAFAQDDVVSLVPPWMDDGFLKPLDGKVHILAFDVEHRRRSSKHVTHVWIGQVPPGSFYRFSDTVFIASPEFSFLVAASMLDLHSLIAFGYELCGLYGFDESCSRGFRKRSVPLTSRERLMRYVRSAQGCRGYKNAVAALRHVVDNSASPMETLDHMLMCLPPRLGGYSLPPSVMNYEIPLSPKAARIAKRRKCYADMYNPKAPLDVEHHGKYDHSSPEDRDSDRARVNALKEMGLEVIELTGDQVGDLVAFEYIASRIAKLVGKRIRKENLGATEARLELRSRVFKWNRSYGRLR